MDERDKEIQELRRENARLKRIQRRMLELLPDDKTAQLLAEVISEDAAREARP